MSERNVLMTPSNLVALSILTLSSLWLAWWFYDRSQFVYVTDARIAATMINISSRIPGWVTEFPLDEGQLVKKGEILARIDARDARLQLEEVEEGIATLIAEQERHELELTFADKQIHSTIAAARSSLEAARAGLSESSVGRVRAEKDFIRARSLLAQKMISEDVFEEKQATSAKSVENFHRNQAQVAAAEASLLAAEAELSRLDVVKKGIDIARSKIREMEVERNRLKNLMADHEITSPIDGIVDETFINTREHVYPGQRILMLHDPHKVWVKANIKETEIRHLNVGGIVHVSVDAFPGRELEGKITNIGSSATSQFAMLPSPNPSGNFTKVTQRIEVHIEFTGDTTGLKPGMMVELRIPVTS